ncbi:putative PurR-regulated permease PerM [Ruminiclostridium sufflavum DSM 19573]|uniref:Putative PurR-regulated permease PerM n=1 Tax=Ruminiclostridium sufflavum DSM 19573 TaxID=1121337 RepID=A0A318XNX8_9FIRM|nr:AI-2E family transporter [Ruminiclostridium sufflavum]PYG87304.1 putative PurR-regulated permease PerM [Ruminiclostridium sufflavum DSM 19573]
MENNSNNNMGTNASKKDAGSYSLFKSKFFRYGCYLLLGLLIIFMFGKIEFFIDPFRSFVYSIIFPLLFGGILYYVLRPLVRLLERCRLPRVFSALLSFVIVLFALTVFITYTGSVIGTQFTEFRQSLPYIYSKAQSTINSLLDSNFLSYFSIPEIQSLNLTDKISELAGNITKSLGTGTINFISAITNIGSIIIIIPIVLFYFLIDSDKFLPSAVRFVPLAHKKNAGKILSDIDLVLSNYIAGQLLVAFLIGIFMFLGYLIIGLKYSLILAIFAMLTCIIPFFGPWLGIIPAVLLSFASGDPFMALKVFIVMLAVQQIDNNFISPQVMKKSMDIHPLTVILLLMGIIPILGFIGLLVVIPLYSAIKVTIKNVVDMYYPEYAKTLAFDKPPQEPPKKKSLKVYFINLRKKK